MCNHTVAMMASVRREVVLPVAPEELWPALTEPDRLAEWFAPEVEIDARPGGGAVFRWEDGTRRAVVEEVDAPHRLSFRWAELDSDGGAAPSRVEFSLEEVEGGTRLRVVETGLSETLAATVAVLGAAGGWGRALRGLGAAVELRLRCRLPVA
jgi:uncharacterized protein YndB with AHSA1/START domain